ncbi:GAR2-like protein [Rhynchospora pubera]|uniref:GAR2-like protein n=1 Tax=Rhynchospora pubera TaxID=906938 RepID=A0AAV8ECG9_9POAL|nr:GAR2-like protein [Rhynchospora pubera]
MLPGKPLLLKDYLELDTESSNTGFQCYPRLPHTGPTVRHLLDVELRGNGTLVRTKSRNTFNKLSSAIKFRFFQKQESGFLSRSLSRKLRGGSFWRRRWQENDICKMRFEEEMERRSFDYPSPVVSSFRSWLEMENGFEFESGTGPRSESTTQARKEISAVGGEEKKVEEKEYPMEQCMDVEKEQLSPVSVMDFPFDEEEEDDVTTATTSSPSFHRSTPNNTERTMLHIVQKSRRFDNIAELNPVDLEEEFNAVESRCHGVSNLDDREIAWNLVAQLDPVVSSEMLLVDFFIEGLSSNVQQTKLLNEARDWINDEGWRWELQGCRGQLELQEMERNSNWRCFEGEKPEVSIDLESIIIRSLVQELVDEMLE